ncbi:ABC transporter permease [Arthrobacter sp. SX1312]|uniref:ABC transporter permease n=1 Tax=Arthrobacter sp. SX1312 TaxID=2058896 RepID=UPI000CE397EE|nr:polyketide antibiotic transporter [Arthrobacter sp. SX1312]
MTTFPALLGQRVRRDGVQLLLWTAGTALLAYLTKVSVAQAYGTEEARASILAVVMANPVILLFRGLPSGAGEGAFMLFLIFPFLALLAALMSSFLAVRHTRGDEETGRAELVAATRAGRRAPLGATLTHGILANVVLAALSAVALTAAGLGVRGSVVSGLGAGAVGLTFLGVGLVSAQLMRTSSGANSLAVWVLMVSFLTAGVGNALGTPSNDLQRIESSWLTWLSPFGWGEQTRPFAEDNLWPILWCAALGMVLAGVAVALHSVRDLGGSFVPERRGRRSAPATLSTPLGLVAHQTRASILGWGVGGLVTGILATTLAAVIRDIGTDNPAVEQVIRSIAGGADVEQGTVVVFFTMLGILAACCAVQTVCRARQEETRGTAELVLSTPVDRVRWLASFLVIAFVGILVVIGAALAGAAAGLASRDGDWALLGDVAITGAGQIAAASVFLVVTAVIFVVAPRLTIPLGWALVLVSMMLGLFGPLFGFPDWVVQLSPMGVTPTVTGDGVDVEGLWWLVAAVAAGGVLALGLMRRRDLAPAG